MELLKRVFLLGFCFCLSNLFAQLQHIDSAGVFAPVELVNASRTMTIAGGLSESLIYQADNHWVKVNRVDGYSALRHAPAGQDFMHFIPDVENPNTKGVLAINHEIFNVMESDTTLGFGGGMSLVKIERNDTAWQITEDPILGDTSVYVDFSPVGFTTSNCGGAVMPNGNILSGEEIAAAFNIHDSIIDPVTKLNFVLGRFGYNAADSTYTIPESYPEFGGQSIPFDANFGWMTEVDPNSAKAVMKHYHMGRFSHEGASFLSDNRTVILTDDIGPACLFKFVADIPGDFTTGDLFAFKQDPDLYSGSWVQIERELDSLVIAREVAVRKGATLFMRLEWPAIDVENDIIYLSETGVDIVSGQPDVANYLAQGASIPRHWVSDMAAGDSIYWDDELQKLDLPYGSVLKLENAGSAVSTVSPFLRGGFNSAHTFCFNGVDGLIIKTINENKFLVLTEDHVGRSRGRVNPNFLGNYPVAYPKAFLLDLSIPNPVKDDLMLILAGSRRSELTGTCFTPNGNTMFIVNQHPGSGDNDPPYHKSAVFALDGFHAIPFPEGSNDLEGENTPNFLNERVNGIVRIEGFPNPVLDIINLNKIVSGEVFTISGKLMYHFQNRNFINLSGFSSGTYVLKTSDGEILKIIK